jgi:CubicO group peptidase (beta-lactamase class C family)
MLYATPEEINIDRERLQVAYALLDEWTAAPGAAIPGAAIAVGRHGRAIEPQFFGRQGPEDDAEPIRRDGCFLLASITKPVTYLAAMLLVERGLLSLTDRVTDYVPEFDAHHKDSTLVFHLCTHTSGLPDMLTNNIELRRQHAPLERFVEGACDAVPLFQPGTRVSYQSMGTLMVAEIVKRITGHPLAVFLEYELFGPLGLSSTALGTGRLDPARLVRVRLSTDNAFGGGGGNYHWNSSYWRQLGAPWGGLHSTPDDFAVICQLMLAGGTLGDQRIVSAATVERISTNRLDELPDLPEATRRTQPWGIGWRLNHPDAGETFGDLVGVRAYGHLGATGTMCWIDPEREAFCLLFTTAPLAESHRKLVRLSNAVAAALI